MRNFVLQEDIGIRSVSDLYTSDLYRLPSTSNYRIADYFWPATHLGPPLAHVLWFSINGTKSSVSKYGEMSRKKSIVWDFHYKSIY